MHYIRHSPLCRTNVCAGLLFAPRTSVVDNCSRCSSRARLKVDDHPESAHIVRRIHNTVVCVPNNVCTASNLLLGAEQYGGSSSLQPGNFCAIDERLTIMRSIMGKLRIECKLRVQLYSQSRSSSYLNRRSGHSSNRFKSADIAGLPAQHASQWSRSPLAVQTTAIWTSISRPNQFKSIRPPQLRALCIRPTKRNSAPPN